MITPGPRHQPHEASRAPQARTRHRREHPAALVDSRRPIDKCGETAPRPRPRPQSVEEAKLNLRVVAARRNASAGHASTTLADSLASNALRFAKDHPAALAAGVGAVALIVGPAGILKGATTVARLATVAGFLGKASR